MSVRAARLISGAASISLAGALILTGCGHREGPWPGASMDKFTYVSRPWEPKTITVVDTRTGEAVWSVDVPVGQQLVMKFKQGTGPNEYKPDELMWEVMAEGRGGSLNNRMACPPASARRVDVVIRSSPETVWSDDPASPNYRPEPRPIERGLGRTWHPVEDPQPTPGSDVPPAAPPASDTAPASPPPSAEPQPDAPADEPPIDIPD